MLDEARINLNYTDIMSPVDGVVVSRSVDVGQTVAASFQTPTLFQIAQDLTKMQVDASVSESDIGSVQRRAGGGVHRRRLPGREFHGTVVQVRNAPVTVQNVVTYDVVIAVDNPDLALKPGMTATVTITTGHRDDVLRVAAARAVVQPAEADCAVAPRRGRRAATRTRPSGASPPTGRSNASRCGPGCATSSTPRSTASAGGRRPGRGRRAPQCRAAHPGQPARADALPMNRISPQRRAKHSFTPRNENAARVRARLSTAS